MRMISLRGSGSWASPMVSLSPLLGGSVLIRHQWRKHSTRLQTVSASEGCKLGVVPIALNPAMDIPLSRMQGMPIVSLFLDAVLLLISFLVVLRPVRIVVTTVAIQRPPKPSAVARNNQTTAQIRTTTWTA